MGVWQVRAVPVTSQHLCWDWQLAGKVLGNHRKVGRDPKGHSGHSRLACPVHGPHLQSRCTAGSPGGAGKAHPHFLTPLGSYTTSLLGIPAIPAHPHPSCSAEGNPLVTQTQLTKAKPASSTMTSQQVGNVTILLLQGPEVPWKHLSCPGSRDGIPHAHPREVELVKQPQGGFGHHFWSEHGTGSSSPPSQQQHQGSFSWEKTSRIPRLEH